MNIKKNLLVLLFAAALFATVPVVATADSTKTAAVPAPPKTQVPGYYRMLLGDFEVTALYDGFVDIPSSLLKGMDEKAIAALLRDANLDRASGVQTAVNGYLINTGKNLVLVDAGTSHCFGPTLGALPANLRAAGYTPEQVDTVLLTHLHPDHACGISDAGKALFPNATVRVSAGEAEFWLDPDRAGQAPANQQALYAMAHDAVAPYVAAGRFESYRPGEQLLHGVQALDTPGHSPGHSSYRFASRGQELVVWGDVMHSHAVQFAHPTVSIEYDADQVQAVASRQRLLAQVADGRTLVGGAHLPFPGLGHVRREGQAYAWVPVEYSPLRDVH